MRKILFVDDEPKVLQGLQRMLRSMRQEWEMSFAENGVQALEILKEKPFDVIVSDMRMPGMDGAELLKKVMQQFPQVVRLILSGQSEPEMIMRAMGCTHQFLSKPCDPELLKATVSRAFALRDLLANEALKQLVLQIQSLPSLPSLYVELTQELQSPDASIKSAAEIISRDVAMTAKILQLVNSAFFGLREHVSSPVRATSLLGLDTVKALALSLQVFSQFDRATLPGFSLSELWSHSLHVGKFAKQICKSATQDHNMCDEALIAGLLHDTGKLVLAANLPREYAKAMTLAREEGIAVEQAEQRVFGASHSNVGAYLLGLWGQPDSVIEAVAFHHQPSQSASPTFSVLTAVHVANSLDHEQSTGPDAAITSLLEDGYLAPLGLSDQLSSWREICNTESNHNE
jgi:HD-like signal output (HDOD) protein